MSARRWMDWAPKKSDEGPQVEPSEPPKPTLGGSGGSSLSESARFAALDPAASSREFVFLHRGPTLPVEAYGLTLDLERRGILLATDADHQFIIPTDSRLTDVDYVAIRRWKHHLGAAIEYRAPEIA